MKLFFYFGLITVGFAVVTMEAQGTVMPSLAIESLSAVTHEMDETVKSGELPIFKVCGETETKASSGVIQPLTNSTKEKDCDFNIVSSSDQLIQFSCSVLNFVNSTENLQIFGVSGYEHGLNPAADKVYTSRGNAIRFHSQRCASPCWFDCKWTSVPKTQQNVMAFKSPYECGRSKFMSQSTIMEETEATPNEFPWMVHFLLVNYTSGKYFTCGGTLVSDIHILTSSYCFFDVTSSFATIVNITLGAHNLSANSSDRFRQIAQWSSIASNFQFNSSSVLDSYFAIVTLMEPVTINDYVQPACLPLDDDPDHVNEPVVLTGWGDYNASGSYSVLRKTTTTVISSSGTNGTCQQQAGLGPFSGFNFICTNGSQRYCSGENGGPMYYYDRECGRWFVIGIAGIGGRIVDSLINCQNSNKPNVFNRVTSQLFYISLFMRRAISSQCKLTTTTPEFTAAPTAASITPNLKRDMITCTTI
ncbi:chymotrypsin-like elastase family member 2A [Daphnia pulex]|uniref:chymotrypsin-like elastase family member 2A n=1 Tax=Daphnia pulex TaxID=6669 RepID=UPI001EDE9EAD|nr:chymotrypsin-like elastase family member 2A [Daphnia pulex]